MTDPLYRGEAWLKSWRDSSSGGRTITLQIDEDGTHPFKGYEGERFAVVIVPVGNDEKPIVKAVKEEKPAKPKQRWDQLRPSARAALLTRDPEFWAYQIERYQDASVDMDEAQADEDLKRECGITSKRELDDPDNQSKLRRFQALEGNFRVWVQAKGHQAA